MPLGGWFFEYKPIELHPPDLLGAYIQEHLICAGVHLIVFNTKQITIYRKVPEYSPSMERVLKQWQRFIYPAQ